MITNVVVIVAGAAALLASLLLGPAVRRLAIAVNLVDKPDSRKVHTTPMPLLGGVAIYLSVVIGVIASTLVGSPFQSVPAAHLVVFLICATLLLLVGVLDDAGRLHHQIKLMVAMPIASAAMILFGFSLNLHDGSFGAVINGVVTLFWIVGFTASFSILDHMDGLCAGVAAFAAAAFAVIGWRAGDALLTVGGTAVAAAAFGFLRVNFRPAKMFMGDAGAMFLGFTVAILGIRAQLQTHQSIWGLVAPLMVLAVPVIDTSLVIVSRSRRGLVPFSVPGKDHAAHRLSNLGLGHRGAVLTLYCIAAIGAIVGVTLIAQEADLVRSSAGGAVIVLVAVLIFLERAPYERQTKH